MQQKDHCIEVVKVPLDLMTRIAGDLGEETFDGEEVRETRLQKPEEE